MSAPATEDLRELSRLLIVASEAGDVVTTAVLQDELGVGRTDLMRMLDTLREHGGATEVAPDEWSAGAGEEAQAEADAPVRVATAEVADEVDELAPTGHTMLDAGSGQFYQQIGPVLTSHVRLSRGMVAALEPDALGKLIQAGIDDVGDGLVFRFEVTP